MRPFKSAKLMRVAIYALSLAFPLRAQVPTAEAIAPSRLNLMRSRHQFRPKRPLASQTVSRWQLATTRMIGCAPASLACSLGLRDAPC